MNGLLRCSRYSFGPNKLHYCGPDASQEILAYLQNGAGDPGLAKIMTAFQTLYPYLCHIASANQIKDPFDNRVVEAYWIGNDLLEQIPKKKFYTHLLESQQIKRRLGKKSFNLITNKLRHNAVPHHSFHVFNIWQRTGHLQQEHTLESMDNCRISWGTVQTIDGPWLLVKTNPLVYQNKKLMLGEPTIKKITRSLDAPIEIDELKPDDIITMHWNTPCEVITHQQALTLKKYTLRHLKLANQTL